MRSQRHSGFTLVELIIVIAILSGLALLVFVAVNPLKRINDARQAEMESNAEQMTKAINLRIVDTYAIPTVPDPAVRDICKFGHYDPEDDEDIPYPCINLDQLTVEGYLSEIPVTQEFISDTRVSGYEIAREGGTVRVCPRGRCFVGGGGGNPAVSSAANSSVATSSTPSGPQMGSALQFSAGNNAVNIPYSSTFDFDVSNELSISFWLKVTGSLTGTSSLVGRYDTNGYHLNLVNGPKLAISFDGEHPPNSEVSSMENLRGAVSAPMLSDNQFHHILLTYHWPPEGWEFQNPTTTSAKIYVDGNNLGLVSFMTPWYKFGSMANNAALRVGATFWNSTNSVIVDDVRIYNRDLSEDDLNDIATLADRTSIADDTTNGLIHHWNFNQLTGTLVPDSIISGVDGQLVGSPLPVWSTDAPF